MASKTCVFLESGTNAQFEFVLTKYDEALKAKASKKNGKPETLLKLDKWYQTELPKKIKSRGKEAFITHDEIVQTIKWKLARGQFRPRLKDLVQMNTPRVVMQETKKAFRALFKKNDLEAAVQALSNLKGVGPAMASAVLAAGAPHMAPFMADECLLSMPDIEGIDYTMKEYLKLVDKTKECVDRLNSQGGEWTPHKVELAVWTHYIARDLKPELLEDMPGSLEASPAKLKTNGLHDDSDSNDKVNGDKSHVNGDGEPAEPQVNGGTAPAADTDETTSSSQDEDSKDSAATTPAQSDAAPSNGDVNNSSQQNDEEKKAEEDNSNNTTTTPETTANTTTDAEPAAVANRETNAGDAGKENGSCETAVQEKETNGAQLNGEPAAAVQENGVVNQPSAEQTKEETVRSTCDTQKRGLEEEEDNLNIEAKRLKEDSSNPPPIPAAGV